MSPIITESHRQAYQLYNIYHSVFIHMKSARLDGQCYSVFRNGIKPVNQSNFINTTTSSNETKLNRWAQFADHLYEIRPTLSALDILLGIVEIMKNKGSFFPSKDAAFDIVQYSDDYKKIIASQYETFVKDLKVLKELAVSEKIELKHWLATKRNPNTLPNVLWEVLSGNITDLSLYALNRIFSLLSPNQETLFRKIYEDNSMAKLLIHRKFVWEDMYLLNYDELLKLFNAANQSSLNVIR